MAREKVDYEKEEVVDKVTKMIFTPFLRHRPPKNLLSPKSHILDNNGVF